MSNLRPFQRISKEIYQTVKNRFPNQHTELSDIPIEKIDMCVEERDGAIYGYVFNMDYFNGVDDSGIIYTIPSDKFYEKFTYCIDKTNPMSNNDYITEFKSEQECRDYLESIGIKSTM